MINDPYFNPNDFRPMTEEDKQAYQREKDLNELIAGFANFRDYNDYIRLECYRLGINGRRELEELANKHQAEEDAKWNAKAEAFYSELSALQKKHKVTIELDGDHQPMWCIDGRVDPDGHIDHIG